MPAEENATPEDGRGLRERIKKDVAVGVALFATFFGIVGGAQNIKAKPITTEQAIEELSVPAFQPKKFSDLPIGHPAFNATETLYYGGVIKGYPDGTVKPDKNVTRAEFATMLVKEFGINANNYNYSSIPFKDVGKNYWARKYIAAAYENGLIKGYPDGTFKPNNNVTKAEALTMIVNAGKKFDGWVLTKNGNDFSDVKPNEWFFPFIETAVVHGAIEKNNTYIVGKSGGKYYFHPNEKSLRGQDIVFLYKIAPSSITDPDGDGLPTQEELAKGTNPKNPDTDGDGIPDGRDKYPRLGVVFFNPEFGKDTGDYKNYGTFKMEKLSEFPSYKGDVDSKTFRVHTLDELIERDKKDSQLLKINPNSTFYYLYYKTDFYKNLIKDVNNYIMKKYTGTISLDDVYEYVGNKIFEEYKKLNPNKPFFGYGCGEKLFGMRLILNEIFNKFDERTFEIRDENGKIHKYDAKDLYVTEELASSTAAYYSKDGNFSHAKFVGINHVLPLIISKDKIFYTTNFGPTSKMYAISTGPFFEKRKDYTKFQDYIFDNHLNVMVIQADTIEKHRKDMFYDVTTPAAGLQTFATFNMDNETFENVKINSDWPTYKRATEYLLNNDVKDAVPLFRVMSSMDNIDKGRYLLLYGGNGYFIVKISNSLWERFKEQYKKNPNSTGVGDALKIIYSQ